MATEADLLGAFEVHSPVEIKSILDAGISPLKLIKGKRPIDCLIEGYLRSSRFADCMRVMLAAGADLGDPLVQTLLVDDAEALKTQIAEDATIASRRLTLLTAFTSCRNVTALHLCAEFNSIECGKLLIHSGADVNAPALIDGGFARTHAGVPHSELNFQLLPTHDGDARVRRSFARRQSSNAALGRDDAMGDDRVRHDTSLVCPVWLIQAVSTGRVRYLRQHCVPDICPDRLSATEEERAKPISRRMNPFD